MPNQHFRINATVESTPTLRKAYHGAKRHPTIMLPDSDAAGPGTPVVIIRGSREITLTVVGGDGPVIWSVMSRGQRTAHLGYPATAPALSSGSGQSVTLGTDAVGLYEVSATWTHSNRQAIWHVLFAAVELTGAFQVEASDSITVYPRLDSVAVTSSFSFKANVRACGGGGYTELYCVDRVGVGVIQNLLDPGSEGLEGEYSQATERGAFAEHVPGATAPWVDASVSLPLYDATVTPGKGGWGIEFSDAPGLVVPPFVLPHGAQATPCDQQTTGAFTLSGARGRNSFRTAVVAWSIHAPHTLVVVATLDWDLHLDAGIDNPGTTSASVRQRGSRDKRGTQETARADHRVPLEANDAGFEVYGPLATSGGRDSQSKYDRYVWSQEQATKSGAWGQGRAHDTRPGKVVVGRRASSLSVGSRAQGQQSTQPLPGSSGGKDEA